MKQLLLFLLLFCNISIQPASNLSKIYQVPVMPVTFGIQTESPRKNMGTIKLTVHDADGNPISFQHTPSQYSHREIFDTVPNLTTTKYRVVSETRPDQTPPTRTLFFLLCTQKNPKKQNNHFFYTFLINHSHGQKTQVFYTRPGELNCSDDPEVQKAFNVVRTEILELNRVAKLNANNFPLLSK